MEKIPVDLPEPARADQEHSAVAVPAGGAATQNTLRNIRLIIGREYATRIKARSFIITTIILLVLVFLASFIPTIVQFVTTRPATTTQVVVVNEAGSIAGMDETALDSYISADLNGTTSTSPAPYAISSQPPASLESLQQQVKQGQLDILLVLERSSDQSLHVTYDTDASATNDSNLPQIQTLAELLGFLDTAHRLGLTPAQTGSLLIPTAVTVLYSQGTPSTNASIAGTILGVAGAFLIFVIVGLYANVVATGVAEEKSSRIMEILVTAATPFQLMAGKIVGIGSACLTQMGCVVVVAIGGLLLQTPLQNALFGASAGGFTQYLTGVSIPFCLLLLVYVVLAFFLYSPLYAGLGALVKRQEEVQNATRAATMLLISSWLLIYLAISTPDAPWTQGDLVHSVLYALGDAGTAGAGYGGLVGDRRDDRVDALDHPRLRLVCRAPVPTGRLAVRAAAWPRVTGETGADERMNGSAGASSFSAWQVVPQWAHRTGCDRHPFVGHQRTLPRLFLCNVLSASHRERAGLSGHVWGLCLRKRGQRDADQWRSRETSLSGRWVRAEGENRTRLDTSQQRRPVVTSQMSRLHSSDQTAMRR